MRKLESPYLRKVDAAESFAEAWPSIVPNKVKYSKVFTATTPMKNFPDYFEIVKDGRCWCNGFLTGDQTKAREALENLRMLLVAAHG